MTIQIELTFEELQKAIADYAIAHGANLPTGYKVIFQCFGPDVQNVGGIKTISAKIVLADQPAATPVATA